MVSVSRETAEQTEARLRSVIARAELEVLPGAWSYVETPLDRPPRLDAETIAVVRDQTTWSALRPDDGRDDERERFGVLSFHFPPGDDNSGFVGWLASELKRRLGTGLVVVCGSNRDRGGVYDYWACPVDLLHDVVAAITHLAGSSSAPV